VAHQTRVPEPVARRGGRPRTGISAHRRRAAGPKRLPLI